MTLIKLFNNKSSSLHNENKYESNCLLIFVPANDISTFLSNTAKALKHSTIHELNDAVVDFLKKKPENSEKIKNVLSAVATHYDISQRTLTTSNARGKVTVARNMAVVILNFDLGLPTRFIASRIFNKWQNSIQRAIIYYKRLDPQIKTDKDFIDTYELLKTKI